MKCNSFVSTKTNEEEKIKTKCGEEWQWEKKSIMKNNKMAKICSLSYHNNVVISARRNERNCLLLFCSFLFWSLKSRIAFHFICFCCFWFC